MGDRMTEEKRYWTSADESIWNSNSLIWENKNELSIIEVVKLLDEQHETIQQLKQVNNNWSNKQGEYEQKVKDTLQKHYNKCDTIGKYAIKDIAEELGVELR